MPVTARYEGSQFFVKRGGGWLATPLFVVLLVVKTTDIVFALDSIPAITSDPFMEVKLKHAFQEKVGQLITPDR